MAKKSVKELSIEMVKKAEAGTLTIGEALDYVSNPSVPMPESYKSINKQGVHVARAHMKTLRNNMETLKKLAPDDFPLGLDTPLKDMRNAEIVFLFRRDGSPDLSNRAYNYQIFEKILFHNLDKYGFSAITEDVGDGIKESMYPRLAGAGNPMGTQRTGLAGERPMEGLLEKEKLDAVYADALPEVEAKYGANTRRLVEYHRNTFQRPEQLVGLKTADVIVDGDNVTVKGKKTTGTDHKGRPELTFKANSPMGRLLIEAKNSTASDLLFDTDIDTFNDAFNQTVGKRLAPYADVLPQADVKVTLPDGKVEIQQRAVTTPSAIRSIVPHYLHKQLKVNKDVVQGLMGHISADTIDRNYIGISANTDLPLVLENPENFAQSGFGGGTNAQHFDRSLLSEEQLELIAGELTEAETQEAKARTAVAVRVQATEALQTQEAVIARAAQMPQEVAAATEVAEGEAQIAQVQSEARKTARVEADAKKGGDLRGMLRGILNKDNLMIGAATTVGAGAAKLATMLPTPADAAIAGFESAYSRATAPPLPEGEGPFATALTDPFDIAVLKGQKFATDRGLPSELGALGATVGQAVTGAVADPEGAVEGMEQMGAQLGRLFGAGPLRMEALAGRQGPQTGTTQGRNAPRIPDPVPTQTGALAAEGFAEKRNTARSAAMEGRRTELVNSFFTMNQP